jgi:hypothetical protein
MPNPSSQSTAAGKAANLNTPGDANGGEEALKSNGLASNSLAGTNNAAGDSATE